MALNRNLTPQEQKNQASRCGCRGADEWCICQNVPDTITMAEWGMDLNHPLVKVLMKVKQFADEYAVYLYSEAPGPFPPKVRQLAKDLNDFFEANDD